jgi:hypothetical protein
VGEAEHVDHADRLAILDDAEIGCLASSVTVEISGSEFFTAIKILDTRYPN